MRVPQKCDAFVGDCEGSSEKKGAYRVRNNDDRNQRQNRVINKRTRVNCDFVETKGKRDQRGHDRVQAEKRGEGDENTD